MNDVVWEPPPRTERRRNDWEPIADALRERAGEWARIQTGLHGSNAGTVAHRIRNGIYKAFRPAGDFDAVSRVEGQTSAVYARYLGDGDGGES